MSKWTILEYVLALLDMGLCGKIERKTYNLSGENVRFVLFLFGEEGGGGSGVMGRSPRTILKKRRKSNVDK